MGSLNVHTSPAAGETPGCIVSKHSRAKRRQMWPMVVLEQVRCLPILIPSLEAKA